MGLCSKKGDRGPWTMDRYASGIIGEKVKLDSKLFAAEKIVAEIVIYARSRERGDAQGGSGSKARARICERDSARDP